MKKNLLLFVVLAFFLTVSCEKIDQTPVAENLAIKLNDQVKSGHLKIAVVSDPHYLHPSLLMNGGENGMAFQRDLLKNPNKALMAYSAPIFKSVFVDLMEEKPDILLIPGDLTKDGEYLSHEQMVSYLKMLKENGTKVYVVPGNNDIMNRDAVAYSGNYSYPVQFIFPGQFSYMYYDFGYGNAIARDDSSLSYVAEPVPGLWILGIDACRYIPTASRSGRITPKTLAWMFKQLDKAKENNITVLGLMHHNLIEHMKNQNQITPSTVIDSSESIADALMMQGLEVIFTGHSHANDITQRAKGGSILYDIATGSPISAPSPYRILILKNKEMEINNRYVTEISEPMPGGLSFPEYADSVQADLFNRYFYIALTRYPFLMTDSSTLKTAAPIAGNAYMAFMAGDEKISPAEQAGIDAFDLVNPKPTAFMFAANSLWTDLGVKDNKWHIKFMGK